MTLVSLRGDRCWWAWSCWFCPGHGVSSSGSCRSTGMRLRGGGGGGGGRSLRNIYEFRKQHFNEVVGVHNDMTSRQDIKEGSQNPHAG